MSLPKLPSQYRKNQQKDGSDDEAERPIASLIDDESPCRTSDADAPGGGDDDEDDWNQIPNQRIERTEVLANRLEIGNPDEDEHDTERRDG